MPKKNEECSHGGVVVYDYSTCEKICYSCGTVMGNVPQSEVDSGLENSLYLPEKKAINRIAERNLRLTRIRGNDLGTFDDCSAYEMVKRYREMKKMAHWNF